MRNIILVTLESVRADHCSFLGYKKKTTPTLEKIAKEGVCFENAYAAGHATPISMIGTFTGNLMTEYLNCDYSQKKFTENIRLNLKKRKTLAENLSERGYTTGAFNPSTFASRYFGFNKGFQFFEDFLFNENLVDKLTKGGKFIYLVRNVRDLLTKQGAFKTWESFYKDLLNWIKNVKQPFFLWIFLLDTHLPYLTPAKYRKWTNFFNMYYYNWKLFRVLFKKGVNFSEKEREKLINAYDNSIFYADKFFERLLSDVIEYDPVIIVHSDHGESFGERGMYGHEFASLYEENIHVPLIIWNGDEKGKIKRPVSMLDLYQTIIELADGKSLSQTPLIEDSDKLIFSKAISWRDGCRLISVRIGEWKYIGWKDRGELYNLEEDPKETQNLINTYPSLAKEMKKVVNQKIKHEEEERKIYKKIQKVKL